MHTDMHTYTQTPKVRRRLYKGKSKWLRTLFSLNKTPFLVVREARTPTFVLSLCLAPASQASKSPYIFYIIFHYSTYKVFMLHFTRSSVAAQKCVSVFVCVRADLDVMRKKIFFSCVGKTFLHYHLANG